MEKEIIIHEKRYHILRLLGHGKGGYSYLAESEGRLVVLKQIHHEPCDYYSFGNKIEAEQRDYARLKNAGKSLLVNDAQQKALLPGVFVFSEE